MDKKRSRGVTIFAWLLIILNAFALSNAFNFRISFELYKSFSKEAVIAVILYSMFSPVLGIICGFGILELKEVMRKAMVAINSLDILVSILVFSLSINDIREYAVSIVAGVTEKYPSPISIDALVNIGFSSVICVYLFYILLSLLVIFFFTRPKVKEQFRKEVR